MDIGQMIQHLIELWQAGNYQEFWFAWQAYGWVIGPIIGGSIFALAIIGLVIVKLLEKFGKW